MRPATRRRASAAVSRPVNVFCWEGWKQPSSGSGRRRRSSAPWPKRGRGRGAGRPRSARRRSAASQAKAPRQTTTRDVGAADVELGAGPGQAGVALVGRRRVRRRRAAHGGADPQRRAAAARRRAWRETGWLAKPVRCSAANEEVARAVAGEHPAGAVGAVRGRRQAEQQHARVRVAEARQRAAPVGLAGEGRALLRARPARARRRGAGSAGSAVTRPSRSASAATRRARAPAGAAGVRAADTSGPGAIERAQDEPDDDGLEVRERPRAVGAQAPSDERAHAAPTIAKASSRLANGRRAGGRRVAARCRGAAPRRTHRARRRAGPPRAGPAPRPRRAASASSPGARPASPGRRARCGARAPRSVANGPRSAACAELDHDLGGALVEQREDALLLVREVLVERRLRHARPRARCPRRSPRRSPPRATTAAAAVNRRRRWTLRRTSSGGAWRPRGTRDRGGTLRLAIRGGWYGPAR